MPSSANRPRTNPDIDPPPNGGQPRFAAALPFVDLDRFDPEVVATLDPAARDSLVRAVVANTTHFYNGLQRLGRHIRVIPALLPKLRVLPSQVRGIVRQPGGGPAARVAVQPTMPDGSRILGRGVLTDEVGSFLLPLRDIAPVDASTLLTSGLGLRLFGDGHSLHLVRNLPDSGGVLGEIVLPAELRPVPHSVVGSLLDLVDDIDGLPAPATDGEAGTMPQVVLGEDGCGITFRHDETVRRFPYDVLVRLVEPRLTGVNDRLFLRVAGPRGAELGSVPVPFAWSAAVGDPQGLSRSYVDRLPISAPISVDLFRRRVAGVDDNGIGRAGGLQPMAGTLGLGYVVHMAQTWTPVRLSLGNLVYSLPLAPGEQQRIAISERVATETVREQESLDVFEDRRESLAQDASTEAVFESALTETVRGSSSYRTDSSSSSWGVGGGIGGIIYGIVVGVGAAGGGGSANSSGSTSSALDGARHSVSRAGEQMHNRVDRESGARRSAQRTGIRIASESESESVTTKVIANHNRTRALTVQYWEVLRHLRVRSDVEGVSLVCFVPLDMISFLPPGQLLALDPNAVDTPDEARRRYQAMVRYAEPIRQILPVNLREGLDLAERFVANPRAQVDLNGPTAATLRIAVRGTFLPMDEVWATVRTRRGTAIGPVRLDGPITDLPNALNQPDQAFSSRANLVEHLRRRRSLVEFDFFGSTFTTAVTVTGSVFLPAGTDPSEVIGVEIQRRMRPLSYQLVVKATDGTLAQILGGAAGLSENLMATVFGNAFGKRAEDVLVGVQLSATELEGLLGGPRVASLSVAINGSEIAKQTLNGFELPPSAYPVSTVDLQPTLTYSDVLKIERTLQHVVRNAVSYSRAVWSALTAEERAIMLESYTIGLPATGLDVDGIEDASQHVPLLNCVGNQVLGFYGNAMIMPFAIPPSLAATLVDDDGADGADDGPLTTGRVQDALTLFHKRAFAPPVSHITLPTRGVLGEAVLGHCPSAERIDLTRFWNWSDSPTEDAPGIADVTVTPMNQPIGGAAPQALPSLAPIITNFGGGEVTGVGSLAQALAARQQNGFDAGFTGLDQLAALGARSIETANSARADALGRATDLAKSAMGTLPELVKAAGAKAEDDQKKKDEDAKKANDKQDAAVKTLADNKAALLMYANGKPTEAEAVAAVRGLLVQLVGEEGVAPVKAVTLLDDFTEKKPDGTPTVGSTAWLTALGLK